MQSGDGPPVQGVALRPAIPGLIVADRAQPTSELLDPLATGVEVCLDARGDLLAYCRAENGALRVDLPDLASFFYERGAGHVRAMPHRPLSPELLNAADVVVVMEAAHRSAVLGLQPLADTKTFLLGELSGLQGREASVPDPFGGPIESYRRTFQRLSTLIQNGLPRLAELAARKRGRT